MKLNKIVLVIFIMSILLAISCVNAEEIDSNTTVSLQIGDDSVMSSQVHEIFVDDANGDNLNDGKSWNSSVKSFNQGLNLASDNSTIYLADGYYRGSGNTKIIIDKSVTVVGFSNTVFDGEGINSIFTINDGITVTFKNIKFINSYKKPLSYSTESVYGASLDIRDAKVTVENCSFMNNTIIFESTVGKPVYGGAISNMGDLTIRDSYFYMNSITTTSGLFSQGGSIYNKGKLCIDNSSFVKSSSSDYCYGAAISNEGDLLINNSIIRDSYALQECKGSAIYNAGNLTLFNSVIENNTISRSKFYFIFGAIYNYGNFMACGNIFRKNNAIYDISMDRYKGSPTIYNGGELNLTYNAFIDNILLEGAASDVYYDAGEIITLDNNWWMTNENPFKSSRINVDEVSSWFIFNLSPEYSKLNLSDSVTIRASWSLNNNMMPQVDMLPLFNVTFETLVNGEEISFTSAMVDGSSDFIFNYTQNKGKYDVNATVDGFKQNVTVDVGKMDAHIKFNVTDNITYLDTFKADIEVTDDNSDPLSGVLSIMIDGKTYSFNLMGGKATLEIPNLSPKTYSLKFRYEGNDDYFKAFDSTEITVKKSPVNLTVSALEIFIGQKGNAVVNLNTPKAQGQAVLYINGERIKFVYLYNGNTNVALNNFAEGEYNITIAYSGSNMFEGANASCIFKVKKYDTSLNVTARDIVVGENETIQITVSPSDLRGKATLNINGVNQTIFLENTITDINLHSLGAGRYDIRVIYPGDNKYKPSEVSTSFWVFKNQTSLSVEITQNDEELNGTILVKTNLSTCTGIVGVYINYRLYELNLTDGMAKFDVDVDKGTNYIYVYYKGDEFHDSATWNTTIGVADEFILIGQNVTAYEYNAFNYTIRLIEYNGIPMPSRIVSVNLADRTYNLTTNDDGIANLELTLEKGIYNITASYLNGTVYNNIIVKAITFNLTAVNITYGEDEIIEAAFDKNVTGKVRFIIPDILDVMVNIADGRASCNKSLLNAGSYTVTGQYVNDLFNSTQVSTNFDVGKANVTLNVNIPSVVPGETQYIIINTPINATGAIKIAVDGNENSVEIKNNQAILSIENIAEGNHNVKMTYDGDDNYNSLSFNTSFYVKEFQTDVIIEVSNQTYGRDLLVTARVNETATGNITFKVGKLTQTARITGGLARGSFSALDVGEYEIEAIYSGDSKFMNSSACAQFEILKSNSTIELFTMGVYLNENIKIYADLSENATGYVTFSMIGYYSPRNKEIVNSMSLWYIEPLKTGNYTVIASYSGDGNYYPSSTTFILQITQRRSVLDVHIDDVGINDVVVVKAKLSTADGEKITSKVKLTIGSRTYNLNIVEGEGSLNLGKYASGNYTYSATYEGSADFSKSSVEGSFKVSDTLLDAKLTSNNLTKYYKGSEKLSAKLTYSNKPISNAKLLVKICGSQYYITTNSKGEATLPINLKPGKYDAEIIFEGTGTYRGCQVKVVVNVLSTVEGVDVSKIYGTNKQYYAIFVDSTGKALSETNVKFTISGKSYTVKTLPNGIARINVNFSPGKYTITATNPVTGETTSNTIKISYRLSENKDLTKYFGASGSYKVRAFDDDGKAVGAGEIVKITVSGKTYNVKTDKNGYASLAINLKPNSYPITAEYKGFKVSNKIVIKPVLTASNISKKQSKTTTFSAKLVDTSGKALSGKKITFKIQGKTFTANTNANGIASAVININLGVGTYKIVSSYGQSSITNTITVKK